MSDIEILKIQVKLEISNLDPKDVEGHLWWNKFLELIEYTQKNTGRKP